MKCFRLQPLRMKYDFIDLDFLWHLQMISIFGFITSNSFINRNILHFPLQCCRENGYSRSLFTRAIESFKKFNSERILYPTLHKQRRMHPDIASWPNKIFYNNKMDLSPIVRMRRSPFKPYTVFQVNTIEDIEIEFVWQLLEFCFKIIKPNRCSYGIICGNPTSKDLIAEMIK